MTGPLTAPAINLASRALGATVTAANDESFGAKESLVVDTPPVLDPGRYHHAGEIVDGWETRRRRFDPGADWALVRLGAPGVIRSVDVDTSHFTGNYPTHAVVEACALPGYPDPADVLARGAWRTVVPRSPLVGDASNVFAVDDAALATHVRLLVEPDGGVARLRVLGDAVPDPALFDGLTVDLLARALGGVALASSDDFYTRAEVLNAPDTPRTMGEGWETRRRRDGGHDWAVFRLAAAGRPLAVEVDTRYFVHNASREVELWGRGPGSGWVVLLPRTRLTPDTRHVFRLPDAPEAGASEVSGVTEVRLDAHPDGGLARLRLPGVITPAGRRALLDRWTAAISG